MRQEKAEDEPQIPNVKVLIVYSGFDRRAEAYRLLARRLVARLKKS